MKNRWMKGLCAGLCACMMTAGLAGCGQSSSESSTQVMGRVTAVSDSEITLAVFEQPEGKGVSGGAVHGQDKPKGTPPAGMPEGGEPGEKAPDGVSGGAFGGKDRPEGTPPADNPGEKTDSTSGDGDKKMRNESTETKKIAISKDTKVYTQQGEDKTEASLSDVQLGAMVSVELDGDEAISITLQTMNGRGGMRQKNSDGTRSKE